VESRAKKSEVILVPSNDSRMNPFAGQNKTLRETPCASCLCGEKGASLYRNAKHAEGAKSAEDFSGNPVRFLAPVKSCLIPVNSKLLYRKLNSTYLVGLASHNLMPSRKCLLY
jgi:hypothetical protein